MRQSKAVQVKHVQIGGGAPVVIQSMTKTDTADVGATVAQIEEMVAAGCEIVRLAVPDNDAAIALKQIRKRVPEVPIKVSAVIETALAKQVELRWRSAGEMREALLRAAQEF